MELRKLEYFLAVADQGSYRKAAEKIHVSQPSLSQQLNSLEEELDFPLFIRSKKGVVLTNAGLSFERSVKRILNELNDAIDDARQVAMHIEAPHELVIADLIVESVVLNELVLRANLDIKKRFPDITLSNTRPPHHECFSLLQEGKINILFRSLFYNESIPNGIHHITLNQNNFCFIVPFDWANGKHITIADVREKLNQSTLFLREDPTLSPIYQQILKKLSLTPRIERIDFKDYNREYVFGLVERGLGIAFTTEEYARNIHNPFLHILSIPIGESVISQALFWTNESSLVQHYIRCILPPDRINAIRGFTLSSNE